MLKQAHFLEDWTLTVDYYTIEIEDMIALVGPDTVYERCLSVNKNPTADPTVASCRQIIRNPADGEATNIDLGFTNQGRAKVSGVDVQLNWTKMFANGGYQLTFGIENLLDEQPPLMGGNPTARPFPIAPSRATSIGTGGLGQGGNSVYEPLGRRGFVSLTMSF